MDSFQLAENVQSHLIDIIIESMIRGERQLYDAKAVSRDTNPANEFRNDLSKSHSKEIKYTSSLWHGTRPQISAWFVYVFEINVSQSGAHISLARKLIESNIAQLQPMDISNHSIIR